MQNNTKHLCVILTLVLSGIFLFSFTNGNLTIKQAFPYKKAGLTKRQAAAHLLDRFTYGAKPGQVDDVVKMGLENWFVQQLTADLPDASLDQMLSGYSTLSMSNEEIIKTFPKGGQLIRMAIRDGAVEKTAVNKEDKAAYRKALAAYMKQNGFKRQRELYWELINQKILRSTYSQNQLQELMTSFWFNHFNVSLTDNDCSRFITAYERDAIRLNALGKFETILLATAKSPAMLTYLDNFKSAASDSSMQVIGKSAKAKKVQGLNENYAREIMELHTLGVDGGYSQSDVTQAARIFTGWTIYPGLSGYDKRRNFKNGSATNFSKNGFVREGDFLFAANKHDQGEKVVLGTRFPANGGYEEGVKLIKMLAQHPATARFISSKLAVRFVNDSPPKTLIDKMAKTFTRTEGDIKQVLITLVSSPEFWSKEAIREKIKTPFELVISSVRSLNAEVTDPYPLYGWIAKMGEKMYAYQAPTGFPDNGQYWINTGSLLTRMNFGLALASQSIKGLKIDLAGLNQNREPESVEEALTIYSQYLMPGRNLEQTIKRLMPALNNPEFTRKVNNAANEGTTPVQKDMIMEHDSMMNVKERKNKERPVRDNAYATMQPQSASSHSKVLAQVVGIIIGSPEFQRK